MRKIAIFASVVLLSGACGGAPAPPTAPAATATPPAPDISEDLSETERATIASMLGSIAVDAIQQALPEAFADAAAIGAAPARGASGAQLALRKRYEIRAEHACWFPYPILQHSLGTMKSHGFIDVNWEPGASGAITASLTLSTVNTCVLGITANLGPQTWALDTSGLKVTSTMEMTPSGPAKRQVFKLQGSLMYFKGPYTTSLPVNLTHTYAFFPERPVQATGEFGKTRFDTTLPDIDRPVRIPAPPSAVTGQWTGRMEAQPDPKACPVEWNMDLDLLATGSTVSGTVTTRNTRVMFPSCGDVAGHVATYGTVGSVEPGGAISFSAADVYSFTGTFSATRITGRFTVKATGQPGAFVAYRQ